MNIAEIKELLEPHQNNKWIWFQVAEPRDGTAKTVRVQVVNRNSTMGLAEIKWYGAWRQYCFFPYNVDTVFNEGCLSDIVKVVRLLNDHHRYEYQKKGAPREAPHRRKP